jgi:hypothetical protein
MILQMFLVDYDLVGASRLYGCSSEFKTVMARKLYCRKGKNPYVESHFESLSFKLLESEKGDCGRT